MITLHPQYIKDANGDNSLVVIPAIEFDAIMEELEDLEDVRLYDEAKNKDTGDRIAMEDAFTMIENRRRAKSDGL